MNKEEVRKIFKDALAFNGQHLCSNCYLDKRRENKIDKFRGTTCFLNCVALIEILCNFDCQKIDRIVEIVFEKCREDYFSCYPCWDKKIIKKILSLTDDRLELE